MIEIGLQCTVSQGWTCGQHRRTIVIDVDVGEIHRRRSWPLVQKSHSLFVAFVQATYVRAYCDTHRILCPSKMQSGLTRRRTLSKPLVNISLVDSAPANTPTRIHGQQSQAQRDIAQYDGLHHANWASSDGYAYSRGHARDDLASEKRLSRRPASLSADLSTALPSSLLRGDIPVIQYEAHVSPHAVNKPKWKWTFFIEYRNVRLSALTLLFWGSMIAVHQYCTKLTLYRGTVVHDMRGTAPLHDLFHEVFPNLQPYRVLPEVGHLVPVLYLSGLIMYHFDQRSLDCLRTFLWAHGCLMFMRGISFSSTLLPDASQQCHSSLFTGSCHDLIFSGHVVIMMLSILMMQHFFWIPGFLRVLLGVDAVLTAFLVIVTHNHYAVDVLLSIFLTPFVFMAFTRHPVLASFGTAYPEKVLAKPSRLDRSNRGGFCSCSREHVKVGGDGYEVATSDDVARITNHAHAALKLLGLRPKITIYKAGNRSPMYSDVHQGDVFGTGPPFQPAPAAQVQVDAALARVAGEQRARWAQQQQQDQARLHQHQHATTVPHGHLRDRHWDEDAAGCVGVAGEGMAASGRQLQPPLQAQTQQSRAVTAPVSVAHGHRTPGWQPHVTAPPQQQAPAVLMHHIRSHGHHADVAQQQHQLHHRHHRPSVRQPVWPGTAAGSAPLTPVMSERGPSGQQHGGGSGGAHHDADEEEESRGVGEAASQRSSDYEQDEEEDRDADPAADTQSMAAGTGASGTDRHRIRKGRGSSGDDAAGAGGSGIVPASSSPASDNQSPASSSVSPVSEGSAADVIRRSRSPVAEISAAATGLRRRAVAGAGGGASGRTAAIHPPQQQHLPMVMPVIDTYYCDDCNAYHPVTLEPAVDAAPATTPQMAYWSAGTTAAAGGSGASGSRISSSGGHDGGGGGHGSGSRRRHGAAAGGAAGADGGHHHSDVRVHQQPHGSGRRERAQTYHAAGQAAQPASPGRASHHQTHAQPHQHRSPAAAGTGAQAVLPPESPGRSRQQQPSSSSSSRRAGRSGTGGGSVILGHRDPLSEA